MSTTFGDAYATVLEQHAELRERLRGLDAHTAHYAPSVALFHLRASLPRLAALFEACLGFEESELAPHIRTVDAWGPAREDAMLAEHAKQRALVARLRELAEGPLSPELGREVSNVIASLVDYMAREEVDLSAVEELEEWGGDQMTG